MTSRIIRPSIKPLIHGDIIKRANLFRWIRDFIEAQDMGDGYYMEFGILNGECMVDAYRQFRGLFAHYYGFDSFEGLPELNSVDSRASELTPNFRKGNFASMEVELVENTIRAMSRIGDDELTLVKGFFSESLPCMNKDIMRQHGIPLVIYIDCDLYSSTVDVLRFIDDLIVTGTWILFDDYWSYRGSPYQGEQRAIKEWLEHSNHIGIQEYCNFEGFGKAFIAYRKDEPDLKT